MSKKNINKFKGNTFKIALAVLIIALIAVVISNIAYFTYINIRQVNSEAELLAAVDTAVESCNQKMEEFGINEVQQSYLDTYTENINNCETPLQKAYIANAMLTYAVNSTNLENSNKISEVYREGGAIQSKGYIVDDLTVSLQQLQRAIYSYTVYNEN